MAEHTFTVEVVYAGPKSRIQRHQVELLVGSTVMQAIEASGMALSLPTGTIDPTRLGIFGRKVAPDQLVHGGDRIEIYRPLTLDPMEARRRRTR